MQPSTVTTVSTPTAEPFSKTRRMVHLVVVAGLLAVAVYVSMRVAMRVNNGPDSVIRISTKSKGISEEAFNEKLYSALPLFFEEMNKDETVLDHDDDDNDSGDGIRGSKSSSVQGEEEEENNDADDPRTIAGIKEHPEVPEDNNAAESASLKVHMVTFATESYVKYANRLIHSVKKTAKHCSVTTKMYGMQDLDKDFLKKNARIFNEHRGAGLWVWKPYIILRKLREVNYGDWVVYVDSKYLFEKDLCRMIPIGKKLDHRCFSRKAGEGIYYETTYTKLDAYKLMNVKPDQHALQIWAGFVMFRKTAETIAFVEEWLKYCEVYRIISFDKSVAGKELAGFRENRNDQTVLHLLFRKRNMKCIWLPKEWLFNVRNDKTRLLR